MRKSRISFDAIDPTKAELRKDLEQQVKAFLKSGGKIKQCTDGQSANADLSNYRKGRIRGIEKMNALNVREENAEADTR
jgi:hypothetical protein